MRSRHYKGFMGRITATVMALVLVCSGIGTALAAEESAAGRALIDNTGAAQRAEATIPKEITALLTAPINVKVESANDPENPSRCVVSYGKDTALAAWFMQDEATRTATLDALGYSECKVFAQIDWSIDDPNGWHYSEKWDSDTGRAFVDEEHPDEFVLGEWAYIDCPCTADTVDTTVLFQELGNPADEADPHWTDGRNGDYSKGWGSILKEGQYEIVTIGEEDNGTGEDNGNTGTDGGNDAGDKKSDDNKSGDNKNGKDNNDKDNKDPENNTDTAKKVVIDFQNHTVYVRVRYGVKLVPKATETDNQGDNGQGNGQGNNDQNDGNGNSDKNTDKNTDQGSDNGNGTADGQNAAPAPEYVFSEWSRMAAYGVDDYNPLFRLDELFQAPVISNVQMLGFDALGHGPFLVYTLTALEETIEAARSIEAAGGFTSVLIEARKVGDEEWVELPGDEEIQNGENKVDLTKLRLNMDSPEDIEIRALYFIYGSDNTEYESAKTETILFHPENASVTPGADLTPTAAPTPTSSPDLKKLLSETVEKKKDTSCKICGVCPVQPLGICLFVWVGGLLALLALILLIARRREERRRKPAKRRK